MFAERLAKNAKELLALLNPLLPEGTYMAGGTALALHINHRDSYDLDFYSPIEFDTEQLKERLAISVSGFAIISTSWQTIIGKREDTEMSLFYYKYPILKPHSKFGETNIASIEDIAAMKINAIAGRGLKRDFFDAYCICDSMSWELDYLVELNLQKYTQRESNIPHIMKSLVYFGDAETTSERSPDAEASWEKVKEFFLTKSKEVFERRL